MRTRRGKICTKCKQVKKLTEFYKNPRNKDGHQSRCKNCTKQAASIYRKTEKGKQTLKRYQQTEKGRQCDRQAKIHSILNVKKGESRVG